MNELERAFYRIWGNLLRPEHGCWTLRSQAKGVKGGYHQVTIGYDPETGVAIKMLGHRLIFRVMYGADLPPKMEVGHLCNNGECWHPRHLAGMTRTQNERMKDPHRVATDRRRTSYV